MKKTIGKYMVVGMVALTMTACNDSFLERTPTNNLNDAMYWKSEADLKAYANGIYNEAASNGTYKFMVGFHSDSYSVKITGPYSMEAMSDNFATMDGSQTWAAAVAAGIENQPSGKTSFDIRSFGLLRRVNVVF